MFEALLELPLSAPQSSLADAFRKMLADYRARMCIRDADLQQQANTFAQKGAELLDEKRPLWAHELAGKRIRITSYTICVLGYLYGHYSDGVKALGIENREDLFGFQPNLPSRYGAWFCNYFYRTAWEAQIALRV